MFLQAWSSWRHAKSKSTGSQKAAPLQLLETDGREVTEVTKSQREDTPIYSALPNETCIRLIKREGVDEDGRLKLSLTTVDLAAQQTQSPYAPSDRKSSSLDWPMFHCLSYTWGNPHANGNGFRDTFHARGDEHSDNNLTEILCNGRIQKIRKNLHDFLMQPPDPWTNSIRNRPHPQTGRILLHDRVGAPGILHTYVGFGDDVDCQDDHGQTPLHLAARLGNVESVLILLKGGASVYLKDRNGRTAEDLAGHHGNRDIKRVLKEARKKGSEHLTARIPPYTLESPDDYIWIDALCIDQSNLDERASQVAIMDQIYSKAAYTIVWLGDEDEHTAPALSAIQKLSTFGEHFANSDLVPYRSHTPEQYERYSIPYISDAEWTGLAALFLRQWFRRIWIVQEVVLSSGIIIRCGKSRIQWPALCRVASVLFQRAEALGQDPSTVFVPLEENACGISYHLEVVNSLRQTVLSGQREGSELAETDVFDFYNLGNIGTAFNASDPRDKVYALLPMAKIHYGEKLPLVPSYKISTAECYARFATLQIQATGSLQVLTHNPDVSTKKIGELPSWVPDYSVNAATPLRTEWKCRHASAFPDGMQLHAEPSEDDMSLRLRGLQIGTVEHTAAPRAYGAGRKKYELDESWFDLLDHVSNTHGQGLGEVLWRTLCANAGLDKRDTAIFPAPASFGGMFKRVLCSMMCNEPEISVREKEGERESTIRLAGLLATAAKIQDLPDEVPSDSETRAGPDEGIMANIKEGTSPIERNINGEHFDSVRHLLPRLDVLRQAGNEECIPSTADIAEYFAAGVHPLRLPDGIVHTIPGCEPFLNSHAHAYSGRRLFTTNDGDLALGPASIQQGDELWLVHGFGETMVLRRREEDGEYEYVGEAYVHDEGNVRESSLRDVTLV